MINKLLLNRASGAIKKLLDNTELEEGEIAAAILVTKLGDEVVIKTCTLASKDEDVVISRSVDGVNLADIL